MPKFPVIPEDKMRQMLEPPRGPVRLIIDTDTHNEIDDQFTIAWALLSQNVLKIEGMLAEPYSFAHHREPLLKAYEMLKSDTTAQFPPAFQNYRKRASNMIANDIDPLAIAFVEPDEGMELSYQEILKVYDLMDEDSTGMVFRGAPGYLTSLDKPIRTPAVDHLIERAFASDDEPLYVAAIGCVTNIASAILLEPEIISRIVVLWTSAYPTSVGLSNAPSLNLVQD
ncbi:MAG: hypothetical protein H7175_28905, partial [Burkholderiales bacterium]|nr:hypothetical protein [Anaerolineae bacterium]